MKILISRHFKIRRQCKRNQRKLEKFFRLQRLAFIYLTLIKGKINDRGSVFLIAKQTP